MCVRVSLRKRCASFIALTLFLALKLSLAFPIITSSSVGRHHKQLDEIKLYLQSNNDVNLSIQDENIAQEIHKNRHNIAPINRILSSIVAISVFAFHDPSLAMSNDSIQTSFLNTRQVSAVSFIIPKATPTVYYSFTGVDATATPSVQDVISEENKRIAEQMKEVDDRDSRSTLMYVIEEEDERITQQMQEVGITTRIDSGAVTVNDVREESQRKLQQHSKSAPASSNNDRTTQQLGKQQLKGAGITSAPKPDMQQKAKSNTRAATLQKTASKELQTSDIKKIAAENKIEVELKDTKASAAVIKIDRETFTKVKVVQPPFLRYLPSSVQPLISSQFKSVQVLKSIPDDQLFIASVVAGSLTEVIRTTLLYPLSTVKARVQARSLRSANRKRKVLRKLKVTWLTFLYETKKGGLYAGLIPSLLITVPASGVYAGTKEVSRRAFTMAIPFIQNVLPHDETASTTVYSALVVSLLAAFVADITALALRTPADVLSLRLQVFGDTNVNSDLSSWLKDSIALLPAMIVTDIPYLLSRIFLNAAILTSSENLGTYEVETIAVACICAFLTTPFDVARTRILLPTLPSEVESDESVQNRRLVAPSKYREQRRQKVSVPLTMKRIVAEGNGVQNLYTGWLERTVFLGLGRAWLDPLRIIGYLGLRDAILLKFFD
ncbi:mitochondrial carrier protein [Skeletonema marinoi]|uniref:Mitochondrial carrier protein n=1 Tax=Skeletonema marinoi TaxID=267567 RepID=A0AAD9DJC4_9STRA|nr:mitochondrial carrier protein [Skeletonema marinoi]